MRGSAIIVGLLLLIQIPALSQENSLFFPQGFVPNINAAGFSKSVGSISNISSLNPAALSSIDNLSAGISYQFSSRIKEAWFGHIDYLRNKNGLPQSAGIVIPFKDFRFAAAMNQKFNGSLDFGNIPITTVENPVGNGEYVHFVSGYNLINFSIIESWSAKNIFSNDKFSLGVRIDLDKFYVNQNIGLNENYHAFSFAAGFSYEKVSADILNRFSFYYEKGADVQEIRTITLGNNHYQIDIGAKSPDKLNFGADFSVNKNLLISSGVSYVYWKDANNHDDNPEAYLSGIYKYSDLLSFSAGAFYQKYTLSDFWVRENLDVFYLNVGAVLHFDRFDFNVGIADSHLFSSDWRKQTIINTSLEVRI